MNRLLSLIVSFFALSSVMGQNAFGTLHGNYTPTNSVYVNPSSMLDAKVWLDINIVGVGSYTNNNLVFLENHSWGSISRDLIQYSKGRIDDSSFPDEEDIGYNQNRKNYHGYNRNFVTAPSAVWSQGDHAAALSIGGRSYTAIRGVPDYAAQFIENGVPDFTLQHDIDYSLKRLRIASLHFAEIKGSYAYTFLKRRRDMFMGGVTLSKFFSVAGAAMNIYNADFNIDNDSLALLFDVQADAMFTPNPRVNWKGGMGLDLGFTYQKMLGEAASYYPNSPKLGCRTVPYLYKLGVSIIDIGSVKFDEDDVVFAGYDFQNYSWVQYDEEQINEENPTDVFEAQEASIEEGRVRKPHKIRLPTFASIQFDYNLWASRLYVNATIIQGIPPGKNKFGLRHANSLSVTPRYETYFFEFALPISLYEYQYPQLGASFRIGPLSIGSDKIISWVKQSKIYGMDIYMHLKIPLRYHPKCKGKLKSIKKGKGQKYKKYRPCEAYG